MPVHSLCTHVTQKELPCPGYSPTKPLRWRHRITRESTSNQEVSKTSFQVPSDGDDIAPAKVILDALTYCVLFLTVDAWSNC